MGQPRPASDKTRPARIKAKLRDIQALDLRIGGATFAQIAQQLGWANESGPYKAVVRTLERMAKEPSEAARALELRRLEAMTLAIWPRVMKGEIDAQAEARHQVELRSRIQGFLAVPPPQLTVNVGPGAGGTFGPGSAAAAFVLPTFASEEERHEYLRHCAAVLAGGQPGAPREVEAEVIADEPDEPDVTDGGSNGAGTPQGDGGGPSGNGGGGPGEPG
jgi:hypothetical protein